MAFLWYSKSAAQGYAKGLYQLGMCYKIGEGVKEDRKKAFDLFTKAAKQENGDAQPGCRGVNCKDHNLFVKLQNIIGGILRSEQCIVFQQAEG